MARGPLPRDHRRAARASTGAPDGGFRHGHRRPGATVSGDDVAHLLVKARAARVIVGLRGGSVTIRAPKTPEADAIVAELETVGRESLRAAIVRERDAAHVNGE